MPEILWCYLCLCLSTWQHGVEHTSTPCWSQLAFTRHNRTVPNRAGPCWHGSPRWAKPARFGSARLTSARVQTRPHTRTEPCRTVLTRLHTLVWTGYRWVGPCASYSYVTTKKWQVAVITRFCIRLVLHLGDLLLEAIGTLKRRREFWRRRQASGTFGIVTCSDIQEGSIVFPSHFHDMILDSSTKYPCEMRM